MKDVHESLADRAHEYVSMKKSMKTSINMRPRTGDHEPANMTPRP
jgi:hypothetical protein